MNTHQILLVIAIVLFALGAFYDNLPDARPRFGIVSLGLAFLAASFLL